MHRPNSGNECNTSWHFNATLIKVSMCASLGVDVHECVLMNHRNCVQKINVCAEMSTETW